MHHFKILVGSLNWIVTCMQTDLTQVVDFLSDYIHLTSPDHIKLTLYSLRYIHSTPDFCINFSSTKST